MAVIDKHWARWIFASVCKHFDFDASDNITTYIEGQKRNTRDESEFFELRMDGPIIYEAS